MNLELKSTTREPSGHSLHRIKSKAGEGDQWLPDKNMKDQTLSYIKSL